jgi:hypothetical protein
VVVLRDVPLVEQAGAEVFGGIEVRERAAGFQPRLDPEVERQAQTVEAGAEAGGGGGRGRRQTRGGW